MRIWDVNPSLLARQNLLGEHRELHCIWNVITQEKKGYAKHPETMRWRGKLMALYNRHELLVSEMTKRGYNHKSILDKSLALDSSDKQDVFINTIEEQMQILETKNALLHI